MTKEPIIIPSSKDDNQMVTMSLPLIKALLNKHSKQSIHVTINEMVSTLEQLGNDSRNPKEDYFNALSIELDLYNLSSKLEMIENQPEIVEEQGFKVEVPKTAPYNA